MFGGENLVVFGNIVWTVCGMSGEGKGMFNGGGSCGICGQRGQ